MDYSLEGRRVEMKADKTKMHDLIAAEREAKRFLATVAKWRLVSESEKYLLNYCKESAACKRSSLDLTRALAEMRKT